MIILNGVFNVCDLLDGAKVKSYTLNVLTWMCLYFRLCTMTLTRLELLKPLEPGLTEVIISVSMQVNKYITEIFLIA